MNKNSSQFKPFRNKQIQNDTSLYNIFMEYRKGNEEPFNQLASVQVKQHGYGIRDENDEYQYNNSGYTSKLIINNKALRAMILCSYFGYINPYKNTRKKTNETPQINTHHKGYWKFKNGIFTGDIEDMAQEYLEEFLILIKDENFEPKNQTELCQKLKSNITKKINNSFIVDEISLDEHIGEDANENHSDYMIVNKRYYEQCCEKEYEVQEAFETAQVDYTDTLKSKKRQPNYIGLCREALKAMVSVDDIKCFTESGATFQQNVLDMIYEPPEKNGIFKLDSKSSQLKLKKYSDVAHIYRARYNVTPSEQQIGKCIQNLRATITETAVGYDFFKINTPAKKPSIYNTPFKYVMIPDEMEKEIAKYCKRQEGNCKADEQYCRIYKQLELAADNLVRLLSDKGYFPDRERILDIALFMYGDAQHNKKSSYWNFCRGTKGKSKDKFKIDFYNKSKTEKDSYFLKKGATITFDDETAPECYKFGNCIIFIDRNKKSLIYLQEDNLLFFVKQHNNRYIGQTYNISK